MELMNIDMVERMKHYHVTGLGITLIEDGEVHSTRSYGYLEAGSTRKVNENFSFSACSISKFLTSMLVMKLTEQGTLHLDEDVNNKLYSWKVPNQLFAKPVTLRNLLSHQSGIIDPEGSFSELIQTSKFPTMNDLLNGKTPYCKEPIEVTYEPESEFHYSDAGYCVIQQLIEDVTEKNYSQVMNEQLFKPLKMDNSTFIEKLSDIKMIDFSCGHNKSGELVSDNYPIYPYPAASGLWTTSKDLAQVVLEMIHAMKGMTKLGISTKKAIEMISPQFDKSWSGLGVFLDGSEKEIEISSLGWGVGFQCMLVAFPYLEKGAVILTNAELGIHQLKGIIGEIYRSVFL
ncbi:serine hydrolase domain-containing protein [Paucisalibacillus globulus]|uniref:serine hydrolase domain-containing protein n=1 Tax=Paucisalibacillus globulus TaxID=351095 RepID=UPI0003F7923B|nr:serine hydrolase domain-containing protein [Paucisalibacillus globulus]